MAHLLTGNVSDALTIKRSSLAGKTESAENPDIRSFFSLLLIRIFL
jgi:hypothetical protein